QIGAEQEARDIAAPIENLHLPAQPQRLDLQQEGLGIVLADGNQPRALFQLAWQRCQSLEAAVQALGLEAGAYLHQQQVVVLEAEFATEISADLGSISRRPAVLSNARRQQMEAR